jgi:hypothetical protein
LHVLNAGVVDALGNFGPDRFVILINS